MTKREEQLEHAISRAHRPLVPYLPNLKLFRYVSSGKKMPHLYAEAPDGKRIPLCRNRIDTTVGAVQIEKLRGDECANCKREAQRVLAKKSN
jgi:hypothetical protein